MYKHTRGVRGVGIDGFMFKEEISTEQKSISQCFSLFTAVRNGMSQLRSKYL